jgi:hypothetical protein
VVLALASIVPEVAAVVGILAAGQAVLGHPLAQNDFGDTEADGVAGPLGLVIIVLLAIATVLLIRNMNRRLRRLPDRFDKAQESGRGLPLGQVSRQDHSHVDQPDRSGAVGDDSGGGHRQASVDEHHH